MSRNVLLMKTRTVSQEFMVGAAGCQRDGDSASSALHGIRRTMRYAPAPFTSRVCISSVSASTREAEENCAIMVAETVVMLV